MSGFKSGHVAIAGWTNVGKSTLLNRLVGEKIAAVANVPQTTRHRITGVLTLRDRGQIVFVDTPGFHHPRERMNRLMVDAARGTLTDVDLVLLVVDAERGPGRGDAEVAGIVAASGTPAIAVLNKVDLVQPKSKLLPWLKRAIEEWKCVEVVPVSAATGDGCDLLIERVLAHLPEGEAMFPDDFLTDQPERMLVAEWVRERILVHTREEIPHAAAVSVRRWHEREDGLVEIEATIYVERDSQKGIVIGKGGGLLKAVGTEARAAIERQLGRRVFLSLRVEVREDWRNDPRALGELGIG
jgi:GTP-binding protein Era